jgi:hypothetical protein
MGGSKLSLNPGNMVLNGGEVNNFLVYCTKGQKLVTRSALQDVGVLLVERFPIQAIGRS